MIDVLAPTSYEHGFRKNTPCAITANTLMMIYFLSRR